MGPWRQPDADATARAAGVAAQRANREGYAGVIEASVPVRICDNGGWTDTWFGGPGRVLNIAVNPGVEVSIRATAGPDRVVFDVETFGDRYSIVPGAARRTLHPLLEAA